MKKLMISIAICFVCLLSNAQLTKGNFLVGGSGSFFSYNEKNVSPQNSFDGKFTAIDVSASVGYFFLHKLAAGLRPTFSSIKGAIAPGTVTTNSYRIAIGPYVRYYFLNDEKPFNLLTDVSYQFGKTQQLGDLKERGKNNTLTVMGGTEVFFNKTAGLELLLGYKQRVLSIDNSPSQGKNTQSGFQASIGFQIHLENLKN